MSAACNTHPEKRHTQASSVANCCTAEFSFRDRCWRFITVVCPTMAAAHAIETKYNFMLVVLRHFSITFKHHDVHSWGGNEVQIYFRSRFFCFEIIQGSKKGTFMHIVEGLYPCRLLMRLVTLSIRRDALRCVTKRLLRSRRSENTTQRRRALCVTVRQFFPCREVLW